MGEEEDFQKVILKALGDMKAEIVIMGEKIDGLEERIKAAEKEVMSMFSFLVSQASEKGSQCARVAVTHDNQKYCTVIKHKFLPKAIEGQFVFVAGRYCPKPGGPVCFVCTDWEKKEDVE